MGRYAHLAYTDMVRRVQEEQGSATAVQRRLLEGDAPELLSEPETAFIESRDGCYFGSVSETGWPYIQFRGGPPGFLHAIDERTIGFADVRGNRQYISTGNVLADGRVALFLMDYPRQQRLKLFGRATILGLDGDPALTDRLCSIRTDGTVERLVVITVEGFNWNCTQHITPRYSAAELAPLLDRIAVLEAENKALRADMSTR